MTNIIYILTITDTTNDITGPFTHVKAYHKEEDAIKAYKEGVREGLKLIAEADKEEETANFENSLQNGSYQFELWPANPMQAGSIKFEIHPTYIE